MEVIETLYYFVIGLSAILILITVLNARFLDSLGRTLDSPHKTVPRHLVSILVPARNEQHNISKCLKALISQDYQPLEILVLDDQSTDRTAQIIDQFVALDPRVTLVRGTDLPYGWTGKNWACHQLSREARGDILLFIDADTILANGTVTAAVRDSVIIESDLLTIMPRRIAGCITERLMFPLIDWASFCWLPIRAAHKRGNPNLSATYGQFMLFKRAAYQDIGGHESVRGNPLDDFELGRRTKKHRLKWVLFEGVEWAQALPYKGNMDALKAVSRSIFPALYYRVSLLIVLSFVVLALGFVPLLMFAIGATTDPLETRFLFITTVAILMVSIPWFVVCRKFRHSMLAVPFYPLSIALMVIMAFHSMLTHGFGRTNWKDRRIIGRRIRL